MLITLIFLTCFLCTSTTLSADDSQQDIGDCTTITLSPSQAFLSAHSRKTYRSAGQRSNISDLTEKNDTTSLEELEISDPMLLACLGVGTLGGIGLDLLLPKESNSAHLLALLTGAYFVFGNKLPLNRYVHHAEKLYCILTRITKHRPAIQAVILHALLHMKDVLFPEVSRRSIVRNFLHDAARLCPSSSTTHGTTVTLYETTKFIKNYRRRIRSRCKLVSVLDTLFTTIFVTAGAGSFKALMWSDLQAAIATE